uniref:Uncharacterized protein n=1 Tax=Arundo donax TaxID=35708 RepID=A0A0A9C5X3_ARUDO
MLYFGENLVQNLAREKQKTNLLPFGFLVNVVAVLKA